MQKTHRLFKTSILTDDKKEILVKYKNTCLYFYNAITFKLYTVAYYYYYK